MKKQTIQDKVETEWKKKLQEMIDNGWEIKSARVKRPRIKQEKFKVIITCFGPMKITVEEFDEHCSDFRTL